MLSVKVDGLGLAETGLRRFAAQVDDLRPFWRQLGQKLADETQARWPLKKQSGRLRRSLDWHGDRLGPRGIFESAPAQLTFGSAIFYGRFFQSGTARRAARTLIHIDEAQHADQLDSWLRERADKGGLEVT